ncbi:MAG TPA: D-sedoheptulose 7-phosphate isomerase, partial [bacterium]|nr:D-sedoheptulose 7-phosphate isomerase [bacterium]
MKKNWPEKIRKSIEEAVANYRRLSGPELSERLAQLAELVTETIAGGHRVYFCGNGGSAADAQHLAAEFVGRFRMERRGLPAVSLTTDTSVITAVGNDYGFDQVFSRQVEALGRTGDLLFVFSTSGNSDNLLAAVRQARTQGLKTAALLGKDGGRLKDEVDVFLLAPGGSTDRIQEVHILVGHLVAGLAETELAGRKAEPPRRRTREKVVTLARLMSFL